MNVSKNLYDVTPTEKLGEDVAALVLTPSSRVSINRAARLSHAIAINRGWWSDARNSGELIALIHSEASEMLESLRKDPNAPDEHVPSLTCLAAEAADVFIRLGDFCQAHGIDLSNAVARKMEFNLTRPVRHGKAF